MITPDAIIAKASRIYPKAIDAWLQDHQDSFFPYRIPVNLALSEDLAVAVDEVAQLRRSSKESRGYGYRIEYESRRSRTYGLNNFPVAIWIDTMNDLVRLIEMSSEWETLQDATRLLRTRRPELAKWLVASSNWRRLLDVASDLSGLLDIVDYLVAHPRPDCFAREIPIAVSTKLLQANRRRLASWLDLILPSSAIDHRYGYEDFEPRYGLRYARPHFLLRVLDDDLRVELGLPFDELSLPAESLSKLPVRQISILIVENKVNLLTLPSLRRTIALGGLGNGVTQLGNIRWIHENPIRYWGDLDTEGFEILDRLRQTLPGVQSVLMDQTTIEAFQHLATQGNASSVRMLSFLTKEERVCYETLCDSQQRIEQEHLPIEVLLNALKHNSDGGPDASASQ